MNKEMQAKAAKRLRQAENYARAEPSDPFLRARIATHMRNGIAGEYWDDNRRTTVDANYSADEYALTKTDDEGNDYTVPAYRNRSRP